MKPKLTRKHFFKSFGLGLFGIAAGKGIAMTATSNEKSAMTNKPVIRNKRPLGFQWETLDPFLFCVHHEDKFPKGNLEMGPSNDLTGRHLGDDFIIKDGWRMYHGKKVPGFPGHPHRGFETVTVVREGFVDHADSMGAAGRYGEGDVQWMTAGSGVQHSEMFPLLKTDEENPVELFQIWLNLPRRNKMVKPHFKMLWSDIIPRIKIKDRNGMETKIELIAGAFQDQKAPPPPPDSWAADPINEVAIMNIRMEPGAVFTLPKASSGINRTLYFYEGEAISLAGEPVTRYHAVEVESEADLVIENGNHRSRLLLLQGKPIGEPVIQYGPFVMNTKEEINQTFEDYHRTKFGGWPWPNYEQVHAREKGRFAKHSDGRLEEKS